MEKKFTKNEHEGKKGKERMAEAEGESALLECARSFSHWNGA